MIMCQKTRVLNRALVFGRGLLDQVAVRIVLCDAWARNQRAELHVDVPRIMIG